MVEAPTGDRRGCQIHGVCLLYLIPASHCCQLWLQSSSGTDRPWAARKFLELELPSQLQGQARSRGKPSEGSFSAMLAALWEGRAAANKCDTTGDPLPPPLPPSEFLDLCTRKGPCDPGEVEWIKRQQDMHFMRQAVLGGRM